MALLGTVHSESEAYLSRVIRGAEKRRCLGKLRHYLLAAASQVLAMATLGARIFKLPLNFLELQTEDQNCACHSKQNNFKMYPRIDQLR